MVLDDFVAAVFYTSPPPGECDDGVFVECCTDLAGRTLCGPTGWSLLVPPLAVAAQVQEWIQLWKQQELSEQEAYALARQQGYTGSPGEFATEWNPDVQLERRPQLSGPFDVAASAGEKVVDALPSPPKIAPWVWITGAVIGGGLLAYATRKGRR